ncbi:hypothetical protein phiAS5_ORF0264 [Aeromonas phage phiAS5]|uniref:Uncharacterized protein n=1 Tax=Aeromonas phage phiAS5 TaxID=879630 RepID=E1A218_9CAUD|nr:hypothetical protein phiAS5_ORF0264 [Aeromonas phage phiAS5]ADM80107.1 hypothetical protein phiAS5_ORF0264 [Aeromonas phage phiAS5]BES53130.1 hypothetical protein [Aeromonas phage phiWae14]
MNMEIQAKFDELAKQFNVNAEAVKRMTDGVLSRIEYFGKERFVALSSEEQRAVLHEAVIHWFNAQQKLTNDYLMNRNGCRDRLQKEVWNEIKKSQK